MYASRHPSLFWRLVLSAFALLVILAVPAPAWSDDPEAEFHALDYRMREWERIRQSTQRIVIPQHFERDLARWEQLSGQLGLKKAKQAGDIAEAEAAKNALFEVIKSEKTVELALKGVDLAIESAQREHDFYAEWERRASIDTGVAITGNDAASEREKRRLKFQQLKDEAVARQRELRQHMARLEQQKSRLTHFKSSAKALLTAKDISSDVEQGNFFEAAEKAIDQGSALAETYYSKETFDAVSERLEAGKGFLGTAQKLKDGNYLDGSISALDTVDKLLTDHSSKLKKETETLRLFMESDFTDQALKKQALQVISIANDRKNQMEAAMAFKNKVKFSSKALREFREVVNAVRLIDAEIQHYQSLAAVPGRSETTTKLIYGMEVLGGAFDRLADKLPPGLKETVGEFLHFYADALRLGNSIDQLVRDYFKNKGYCDNDQGDHAWSVATKHILKTWPRGELCLNFAPEFAQSGLAVYENTGEGAVDPIYFFIPNWGDIPVDLTRGQYAQLVKVASDYTAYAHYVESSYRLTASDLGQIIAAIKSGSKRFTLNDGYLSDTTIDIDDLARDVDALMHLRSALGEELNAGNHRAMIDAWLKYSQDIEFYDRLYRSTCEFDLIPDNSVRHRLFVIWLKDNAQYRRFIEHQRYANPASKCRASVAGDPDVPEQKPGEKDEGDAIITPPEPAASCSYTYSDWGDCNRATKTQTRTVTVREPAGCEERQKPTLEQSCTPPPTEAELRHRYFNCLCRCSSGWAGHIGVWYDPEGKSVPECESSGPCFGGAGAFGCTRRHFFAGPSDCAKGCWEGSWGKGTYDPAKADALRKGENRQYKKPLTVRIEASRNPADFGDIVDLTAKTSEGSGGYSWSWSGCAEDAKNDRAKVLFTQSCRPCTAGVTVTDQDGDTASDSLLVQCTALSVKLTKERPAENTIPVGDKATLLAEVFSGDQPAGGRFTYYWEPNPDVQYGGDPKNPSYETSGGAQSRNTALFRQTGATPVWVTVLKQVGETKVTVGESEQILIDVISPQLSLKADKTSPLIGETVVLTVEETPKMSDDLVSFWWEYSGEASNPGVHPNTPNSRVWSYKPKNDKPVTITVHAKSKDSGEELDSASLTLTARRIQVSVSGPRIAGPTPMVWKPGVGLVAAECQVAEHQRVEPVRRRSALPVADRTVRLLDPFTEFARNRRHLLKHRPLQSQRDGEERRRRRAGHRHRSAQCQRLAGRRGLRSEDGQGDQGNTRAGPRTGRARTPGRGTVAGQAGARTRSGLCTDQAVCRQCRESQIQSRSRPHRHRTTHRSGQAGRGTLTARHAREGVPRVSAARRTPGAAETSVQVHRRAGRQDSHGDRRLESRRQWLAGAARTGSELHATAHRTRLGSPGVRFGGRRRPELHPPTRRRDPDLSRHAECRWCAGNLHPGRRTQNIRLVGKASGQRNALQRRHDAQACSRANTRPG